MKLSTKSFEFTPRKKKWMILLALCGFSSYGMYKVYNSPSVSRKREKFVKLLGALISILELVSDSAQTLGMVSRDLKEFLASESGEIPNSLKQLSKIAKSNEFSNSLTRVFEAATLGIIEGFNGAESSREIEQVNRPSFNDHVVDKLMSKSGTGFVSVVVGSFARNIVLGFYSKTEGGNFESGLKMVAPESTTLSQLVDVLSKEESKVVMAGFMETFVSSAVAVYLDRAPSMNVYDGICCGLSDPKHLQQVKDIVVYVCSGAVETLIRTSHQVLTSPKSSELCC